MVMTVLVPVVITVVMTMVVTVVHACTHLHTRLHTPTHTLKHTNTHTYTHTPTRHAYTHTPPRQTYSTLQGYDMDYTLIVYDEIAWEGKAYEHSLQWLRDQGLPVDGLTFDPDLVIRGLIMDKELGNLVKVDRFGYVKRAMHGTRMLSWADIHATYGRELVTLKNEGRFEFLNTLFSVSEAVLFCQVRC